MGITLDQYRACIGLFNSFRVVKCIDFFRAIFFHYCLKFIMFSVSQIFKHFSFSSVSSAAAEFQFFYMLYSYCIIMQSWDIEVNPGPRGWRSSLSVCHWNLNTIWVEDYKQKIIQFIRRNQVYFSSSNVSTDTTVIVKDYMLSEKFTFCFKITIKWNLTKSHATRIK